MRRVHIGAVVSLGFILTLAACGSSGGSTPASATKTLTVLVTSSPSATALENVAPAFTRKTGITVKFVSVPYQQLPTKIILAKRSGQATFDIAQFDAVNMPTIVPSGGLLPLDSDLASDKQYDQADFPTQLQNYAKYEGTSYGLPFSTEPFLQFYRPDEFQKAGLKPPTTWAEVETDAATLKQQDGYGIAEEYGAANAAKQYLEMLYTSGGRLLNPKTDEPLLSTPFDEKIMTEFLALAKYSPAAANSGGYPDMTTAFEQQNVPMIAEPAGWFSDINNPQQSKVVGKFATMAPPTTQGGPYPSQNLMYGWLIGISSVSQNQAAAWEFLSYTLSPQNVQAFIKAGAPVPARISTTSNPEYVKELPYLSELQQAIQSATVLPRIPEITQISLLLSQDISAMQSGQMSVSAGMAKAQGDITNVLAQSGLIKG
jgi:ABC-type glycerol-3-phosphate transport system substrate-binding protein